MHKILLQPQQPAAFQGNAFEQIPLHPQILQQPDRCTGIDAALSFRLFQAVQLLDHHQRNDHRVLLKT